MPTLGPSRSNLGCLYEESVLILSIFGTIPFGAYFLYSGGLYSRRITVLQ